MQAASPPNIVVLRPTAWPPRSRLMPIRMPAAKVAAIHKQMSGQVGVIGIRSSKNIIGLVVRAVIGQMSAEVYQRGLFCR